MTGATVLSARWILPIDRPPIDGGWVEISGGEIVRLARGRAPAGARDLGDVALMPGLVNAHTHLELSWPTRPPCVTQDACRLSKLSSTSRAIASVRR